VTIHALYQLADLVAHAREPEQIYQTAVDAIMVAAHADRAGILVCGESGALRFAAWHRLSGRYRTAVEERAWAPGATEPDPLLVSDVLEDRSLGSLREVLLSEGIRACACIPLLHQERLLGRFMVYYDTPHEFSDEELHAAATVATQVVFALDRARADAAITAFLERERAARRQAEAANRAKDDFLAMLAHELRNPLGAIVNAVSILDRTGNEAPTSALARTVVHRQTAHLARLLDDLLDVARIGRGQIELRSESVDLRAVARLAVEAQLHRIEDKRHDLAVSLAEEPVVVCGDAARLQQVVENLLNNATKYTPPGGAVWLTVSRRDREAIVSVRDNGPGIEPERLDSIFDPFAPMNTAVARTEGGLGIGLTLVKRLVRLHRGAVHACSAGRGKGAEFTVRLPLAAHPLQHAERPVTRESAPRRIVVIEDDDDSREALVVALQMEGHDVRAAGLGREGVELVLRQQPDLVLIDIGLPDVTGYEAAQLLRGELGPAPRLVALTGYGQAEDRRRSAEAGFDAHLVKPVAAADVLRLLGAAL
jgi:signal transduction histidine kinase